MLFLLSRTVCEKDALTVCTNSSQEHMHPFKEKIDFFIANGELNYAMLREIRPHYLLEEDLHSKVLSRLIICSVTSANPSCLPCSDIKSSWPLRRPASLED